MEIEMTWFEYQTYLYELDNSNGNEIEIKEEDYKGFEDFIISKGFDPKTLKSNLDEYDNLILKWFE